MTRERKEEIKRYLKERNIPITSLEANSIIEGVEWADRTMVERAICFIEDAVCDATIETGNMARLVKNFNEAMGYEDRD